MDISKHIQYRDKLHVEMMDKLDAVCGHINNDPIDYSKRKFRILLIQRDSESIEDFKKAIQEINTFRYEIKVVNYGNEVLAYLLEHDKDIPDIIFMDHTPDIKGEALISKIKDKISYISCIPIITCFRMAGYMDIEKPFTSLNVHEALKESKSLWFTLAEWS